MEIKIIETESNKRIDNFLAKKFINIPKVVIFKMLKKGQIKVNNKRVKYNYILLTNDIINIKKDLESFDLKNFFDVKKKVLNIIYEDENICLINKPIGILSIDKNNSKSITIQNLFLDHLEQKQEYQSQVKKEFIPSICNRLDFNTSGIIIAAKNKFSWDEINQLIKKHQIDKYYLALVFNKPKLEHEILEAYHYKNSENNLVYVSDTPKKGYKKIITEYWVKASNSKYSLLKIKLVTGKTHQIRAHLNHIQLPIVGDKKYKNKNNNFDTRFKTQALISYKIKFNIKNKQSKLLYLDQQTFKINDIWFAKYIN